MSAIVLSALILLVPVVLAVVPASITQWLVTLILGFVVTFFASYLVLPTLAIDSASLLFLSVLLFTVARFIVGLLHADRIALKHQYSGVVGLTSLFVLASLATFALLSSTGMFRSADLAGVLDIRESTEVFDPKSILMDTEQARFVDQDLAMRASNEKLGEKVGLGAMTQLTNASIQDLNGKLTWVAPIVHKNVFKYLSNGETPGYIDVSASRFSDSKATLDAPIAYGTDGFYFSGNLKRYLYTSGYQSTYLDDYTLELNDQGKPFWVVSKFERTVGMSGKEVTGVLIVDAQTGAIQDVPLDQLPQVAPWVDRVQPESIVFDQITDWGKLSGGFINAYFVGKDVINPTKGLSLVYTKDGRSMWYTGLQSGSAQEGTVGFMMVDTKTGEATMYRRTGITEEVAKRAIEGKVQETGYKASTPIPYNVNGLSTFLAVLKDDKGNPQKIGMVSYNDRSVLAVGNNLDTVLRRYQMAMSQSDSQQSLGKDRVTKLVSGRLDRVGFQQIDGQASLHFTVANDTEKRVFTVSGSDSARYILSRPGDSVDVHYYDTGSDPIIVNEFKNEALMIQDVDAET